MKTTSEYIRKEKPYHLGQYMSKYSCVYNKKSFYKDNSLFSTFTGYGNTIWDCCTYRITDIPYISQFPNRSYYK